MEAIKSIIIGYLDSLRVLRSLKVIISNSIILNNIKLCLLFNGIIFLGSAFLYTKYLEPDHTYLDSPNYFSIFFYYLLRVFYYSFILIPIFIACNILSTLWIDEIYSETLIIEEKTNKIKVEGQDFLVSLANQLERLLIIISFVIQNMIINALPIPEFNFIIDFKIKSILVFISLTILHSIYVFEYILLQKHIRDYTTILLLTEKRIFYFIGYGINLTLIVTYFNSFLWSSAIYLIFFPFFLISSVDIAKKRFNNINQKELDKEKIYFLGFISLLYNNVFIKLLSLIVKRTTSKRTSLSFSNKHNSSKDLNVLKEVKEYPERNDDINNNVGSSSNNFNDLIESKNKFNKRMSALNNSNIKITDNKIEEIKNRRHSLYYEKKE